MHPVWRGDSLELFDLAPDKSMLSSGTIKERNGFVGD